MAPRTPRRPSASTLALAPAAPPRRKAPPRPAEPAPRPAAPAKVREKVVQALKRLHPMD